MNGELPCHVLFRQFANVEEGSQQVDCRDRDNRAEQLKLEPLKSTCSIQAGRSSLSPVCSFETKFS